MIWLSESFRKHLGASWQSVEDAMQVQGEIYRNPAGANRRTLRFEQDGRGYFLKLHWGVGWGEIFKNLVSMRLPVIGAANEWRAIRRLEALGVETMHLEACGEEGWNPARRRSFVVTRELENTVSLEDYCALWKQMPPDPRRKRILIGRIARMIRVMHAAGLNHRDLYICHFLLRQPWDGSEEELHLYLIDLHRVQQHRKLPRRWRVKDLGSLYFSAMDIGLGERDLLRFLRQYHDLPLRQVLEQQGDFLRAVERRALALQAKGIP
ncbi:lipopolysaccharide core heptose(I) kinase RfaP, partial [Thiolapillus sp.]